MVVLFLHTSEPSGEKTERATVIDFFFFFFVSTSLPERQRATSLLICHLVKLPLSSLGLRLKNLPILPKYERAIPFTNRILYGKTQ